VGGATERDRGCGKGGWVRRVDPSRVDAGAWGGRERARETRATGDNAEGARRTRGGANVGAK